MDSLGTQEIVSTLKTELQNGLRCIVISGRLCLERKATLSTRGPVLSTPCFHVTNLLKQPPPSTLSPSLSLFFLNATQKFFAGWFKNPFSISHFHSTCEDSCVFFVLIHWYVLSWPEPPWEARPVMESSGPHYPRSPSRTGDNEASCLTFTSSSNTRYDWLFCWPSTVDENAVQWSIGVLFSLLPTTCFCLLTPV